MLGKACGIIPVDGPNDGTLIRRRTISPAHPLFRQQLTQGSFGLLLLHLNLKLRYFNPKSLYFS